MLKPQSISKRTNSNLRATVYDGTVSVHNFQIKFLTIFLLRLSFFNFFKTYHTFNYYFLRKAFYNYLRSFTVQLLRKSLNCFINLSEVSSGYYPLFYALITLFFYTLLVDFFYTFPFYCFFSSTCSALLLAPDIAFAADIIASWPEVRTAGDFF